MQRVEDAIADGTPIGDVDGLLDHLTACDTCRRQLARMNALAIAFAEAPLGLVPADAPHPLDVDIAALASGEGVGREAESVMAHVGVCGDCLSLLAAVRRAIEEAEELGLARPVGMVARWAMWWRTVLAVMLSSRRRLLLGSAALGLFLGECFVLAFGFAQSVAWVVTRDESGHALPEVWPLGWVSPGVRRLGLLILLCICLAIPARIFAGMLYRRALSDADRRGR